MQSFRLQSEKLQSERLKYAFIITRIFDFWENKFTLHVEGKCKCKHESTSIPGRNRVKKAERGYKVSDSLRSLRANAFLPRFLPPFQCFLNIFFITIIGNLHLPFTVIGARAFLPYFLYVTHRIDDRKGKLIFCWGIGMLWV